MRHFNHPARLLALALSGILITSLPAIAAPPEGKGKGNPNKEHKQDQSHKRDHKTGAKSGNKQDRNTADALISAAIGFDAARRLAVSNSFTGYGALPPGIRKNLARGKPLPPGIAKKMVPGPMLSQLPRYDGYEWRVYGSDLVLVATATAIIADVFFDVFK